MGRLIESVPNISEGRRPEVVEAVVAAVRKTRGVRVLDVHSDRDHNRSVLTLAGDESSLPEAAFRLFESALARIDLRGHRGKHPRLGAVDVVPFVPIETATMADCVALARGVAEEVARRFELPVYLYEEAATAPHRRNLEDIRRGEFEGLSAKLADPRWAPDFGPASPHLSGGASVIGARPPLIAYNINLGTTDVQIAKRIARTIRQSSGGYPCVKALGLFMEERGLAQVSINMTDYTKTPLHRVFETVRAEAARDGVAVVGSEIVGLVPSRALVGSEGHRLRLEGFDASQILENRLREEDPSRR